MRTSIVRSGLVAALALVLAGCGVVHLDVPLVRRSNLCEQYDHVLGQFDRLAHEVAVDMSSDRLERTALRVAPVLEQVYDTLPRARGTESVSPLLSLAYGEFLLGLEAIRRGDAAALEENMRNFYDTVGVARIEGTSLCAP